jgi:hypothetical protein
VLETFASRFYNETFYAGLARARIEELNKKQTAAVVPPENSQTASEIKPTTARVDPTTPMPQETAFDGRWKHVWRALNGDCSIQANTTYLTIKNGKVSGERIVSGHVRPDGVIVYTRRAVLHHSTIGHFSGRLIGNQGTAQEKNGKCIGGITLTKVSG